MCDFAADGNAAEELMLGRTLTVARARELNAKDYFYQMLKDNPEMLKIYPGSRVAGYSQVGALVVATKEFRESFDHAQ